MKKLCTLLLLTLPLLAMEEGGNKKAEKKEFSLDNMQGLNLSVKLFNGFLRNHQFSQLQHLTLQLDEDQSKSKNIEKNIDQLTALQSLKLKRNSKRDTIYGFRLPLYLGELRLLRVLIAHNLELRTLPSTMVKLTELEELNVQNNSIKEWPYCLMKLTALKKLYIDNNFLTEIPETAFEQCSNLTVLSLNHNGLRKIPSTIAKLTSLRQLHLDGNALETLPLGIIWLKSLKILSIEENVITHLPNMDKLCNTLRYLYLGANPICRENKKCEEIFIDLPKTKIYLDTYDESDADEYYY